MKHLFKFNESNTMKTLVIYAGSFNPFHRGHLDITQKADKIFGKENVLLAVGMNPEKDASFESVQERAKSISTKFQRPVEAYDTFLHEFVEEKEKQGYNVVIIRGLRNSADLAYEDIQMKYIRDFKPDVTEIFIVGDHKYDHISSSAIRGLEKFRKGSGSKYLPD